MTTRPTGTIVAVTGEDERYGRVRRRAMERAREAHARLILFDVDAAESPLESPLPTSWSADGAEEQFGDLLTPDDLDAAGRAAVAAQVREARSAGVETWAWLPDESDASSLADYAARHGASLLVLPDREIDLAADADADVEVVDGTPD